MVATPIDLLWHSDERVVRIKTRKTGPKGPRQHSLTGYVVADGLVLTCAHDVVDAERVEVWRAGDEKATPTKVIWPGEPEGDIDLDLIDLALLRVEGLKAPAGRILWGEYTDYVGAKPARCIGFPRSDKENGKYHAARIDGGFVPGEGSGRGRMLFTVDSVEAVEPNGWSGLSGAMILNDECLLGIVAELSKTREHRFHAVPASVILDQPGLRELLGEPELLRFTDRHPLIREPFEPLGEETEFKLITARYGQVPFVEESHGEALDALKSWCLGEPSAESRSACDVSLRLLTGPAGAGKTRLAGELCREVARSDPDWRAGFAFDDHRTPWGAYLPPTPLLVVFDYVERAAVAARVIAFLKHLEQMGEALRFPVRVLLVSRVVAGWYEQMTDQGGTLLQQRLREERAPQLELSRQHFGRELRRKHFEKAYGRFIVGVDGALNADAYLDLVDGEQYDSPLLVHIAALLAARREVLPSPEREGLQERLLGFLLRREQERRWGFSPALSTTKVSPAYSDQALHAVAIMTLTAPTVREAAEFLKASALWSDQSNAARREAAKALVQLYPADGTDAGVRSAPIEPDLVSEYLVASVDDLAEVLTALNEMALGTEHHARMLHLLALTCDHYPEAVDHVYETLNRTFAKLVGEDGGLLMAEMLDRSLPKLIGLAVKQVVDHGNPAVANLLANILERIGEFEGVAEAMANTGFAAHQDDERLARLGRVLYDIKVRQCREAKDLYGLVDALEGFAGAALATNDADYAFSALTESRRVRETIGMNEGMEWTASRLVMIRDNFVGAERHVNVVEAAEAVLEFYRVAGHEPLDLHRANLDIMEAAASAMRKAGLVEEARAVLARGVTARLDLGMSASEDFRRSLAHMETLATQDVLDGRVNEALQVTFAALRLRRTIAHPDVDSCRGDFERIEELFKLETDADAKRVSEMADLLLWLAESDTSFTAEAAQGLEDSGRRLWWRGQDQEALRVLGHAVEMRRRMLTTTSGLSDLMPALRDLALAMWRSRMKDAAFAAFKEIVQYTLDIADLNRDVWSDHVTALEDLAAAHWDDGDADAAMRLMRKAEQIERGMNRLGTTPWERARPPRPERFLAERIGDIEPLMLPETKATMLERLVVDQPKAYETLAATLEQVGEFQIVHRGPAVAAVTITKAVEIWRNLAEVSLGVYGVRLREALIAQGLIRIEGKRLNDAHQSFEEAMETHQAMIDAKVDLGHNAQENLKWLMELKKQLENPVGRARVRRAEEKGR